MPPPSPCDDRQVRVYFPPSLGFDHPTTKKRMAEAGVDKKVIPKKAALRYDITAHDGASPQLAVNARAYTCAHTRTARNARTLCTARMRSCCPVAAAAVHKLIMDKSLFEVLHAAASNARTLSCLSTRACRTLWPPSLPATAS